MTVFTGIVTVGYYIAKQIGLFIDLQLLYQVWPAPYQSLRISAHPTTTVVDLFEKTVDLRPTQIALLYQGINITFMELEKRSNQVAQWALKNQLPKNQVVVLLMENRPEFITTWLGLAKVGIVSALVNTHVVSTSLLHCIQIVDPVTIIFGSEMSAKLLPLQEALQKVTFYMHEEIMHLSSKKLSDKCVLKKNIIVNAAWEEASVERPGRQFRRHVTTHDPVLMIYTSGTTGLPKAAPVLHSTFLSRAYVCSSLLKATPADRLYSCLPLYHSAGGTLAVGISFVSGSTLVLSRKFSASGILKEIRDTKSTILQYIGELCRYMLLHPEQADDGENTVRIAMGNGLRPDIWKTFMARYAIPTVVEFYGSTEVGTNTLFFSYFLSFQNSNYIYIIRDPLV